ncbi:hypothetical protein [Streptomyces sp. NPDC005760]|uniref:hypothetical protein n=1 Tax=Streptomyces sp. NPDC005760 TaxID=3156718 RepID=UPI00340AA4E4
MAVDQLPGRMREFVAYLEGLLGRLDQGAGWCAVFWQRDPDGMQACLDGREVPPWDVMEALLQDLSAGYGPEVAHAEAERVRPLHAAAQAAHDARPGGRDALQDRFDVMLREQRYAAERQAELGRRLATATTQEEADGIRLDLAWARDDHERAVRRCAELRSRMAELDARRSRGGRTGRYEGAVAGAGGQEAATGADTPGAGFPDMPQQRGTTSATDTEAPHAGHAPQSTAPTWADASGAGASHRPGPAEAARPGHAQHPTAPAETAAPGHVPLPTGPTEADALEHAPHPATPKRRRRRGGARFAGAAEESGVPVVVPSAAGPELPTAPVTKGRTLRGARYAGADDGPETGPRQAEALDAVARRETAETVAALVRLRSEGRTGEAHALLVEAAHWPADRFPLLAAELQHAGLGADWATLLWEAASLPADRLVAAADALVDAGRSADGEQILRQGVARPAGEIGAAVLALVAEGRRREVTALLDAYVRVRTPEEAARSAEPDQRTMVPLLLAAAKGVSQERHWDLVHALRVAGFSA